VESEFGFVDASVEAQFDQVAQALHESPDAAPRPTEVTRTAA
jgi:flagellar biosynthesis/type III secretory pathway protein FliH